MSEENPTTENPQRENLEVHTEEPVVFPDGEVTTRGELEAKKDTEKTDEASGEADRATKKADETDKETDENKRKRRHRSAQRRINQAVLHQRQAERERDEALAKLKERDEELSKMRDKGEPTGDDMPAFNDFETPEQWMKAVLEYEKKNEKPKDAEAIEKAIDEREIDPEVQNMVGDFYALGEEAYDDWKEAVTAEDFLLNDDVIRAVHALGDVSADVIYYLAKHPEESAKLVELRPVALKGAVRKVAAKLDSEDPKEPEKTPEKKPEKKVTSAPEPPNVISGGETPYKDPDSMTQKEYEEARRKGVIY